MKTTALLLALLLVGPSISAPSINIGSNCFGTDSYGGPSVPWIRNGQPYQIIKSPVGTLIPTQTYYCVITDLNYHSRPNPPCGSKHYRWAEYGTYHFTLNTNWQGPGHYTRFNGVRPPRLNWSEINSNQQWDGTYMAPGEYPGDSANLIAGVISTILPPMPALIESAGVSQNGSCVPGNPKSAYTLSSPEYLSGNFSSRSRVRYDLKGYIGSYCNQQPQCNICSWPYASVTSGCGCTIDKEKLLPIKQLTSVCYVWAQTADCGGQSWYDESRSQFDANKGPIRCAASCPATGKTVYMPARECPEGTIVAGLPSDSTGQSVDSGGVKDDPMDYGKGDVSGGGSGSDTGTHTRLDSILGLINDGRDGDSLADLPDSSGWDSVTQAGDGVQGLIDSLGVSVGRTGGPWSASIPWPDTIQMTMTVPVFGTVIDTALVVDWVIPGFPFDLWSLFRWIEWTFVTIAMIPLFVRVAGGNEDT